MREISGDAWEVDCDVLCITTNCTLYKHAQTGAVQNVMGGGIAGEAARRFPDLPFHYAWFIRNHGHHAYLMRAVNKTGLGYAKSLLMFPTKNEVRENSTLERIHRSCIETELLSSIYGWKNIALPRPGAGLGGLDWHSEVRPMLLNLLDDKFIIVSYPGEK